jgi:hypothetical protein
MDPVSDRSTLTTAGETAARSRMEPSVTRGGGLPLLVRAGACGSAGYALASMMCEVFILAPTNLLDEHEIAVGKSPSV